MNYAVEMGSSAMKYEVHIKFHKNWFSHSKIDWMGRSIHRQTKHRTERE
jgi:hypothetical protein